MASYKLLGLQTVQYTAEQSPPVGCKPVRNGGVGACPQELRGPCPEVVRPGRKKVPADYAKAQQLLCWQPHKHAGSAAGCRVR